MDQKFATLDDLSSHYRLFINRIQQQIATIGGGGAGFIKDLDDVSFDQTTGTNELLIYNGAKWVGIASTALSGAPSELAETCTGTNLTVTNLSVTGIATYEDVKNVDSLGIVTARSDVRVGRNLNVVGIATVSTAFYMPQYTTTARDAGTFNEGAMIYNTTTQKMEFYNGTSWQSLPGMTLGLTVALDG
jgi:hypothetical protein